MPHTYRAYGLTIYSDLPLPELKPSGEAEADVIIRLGRLQRPPQHEDDHPWFLCATPKEAYLFWEDVGAFLVRGGREIIVDPAPRLTEEELRQSILSGIMGVLLYQRGKVVLHASAVKMDGGAVAFMGAKGLGKSTTVATLHSRGHALVADDIMAVEMDRGVPMVPPGIPQLRLWPDSVASLGQLPERLPRILPDSEKRAQRIGERFAQSPIPLKRMYLLEEGTEPEIEPLQPKEALLQIIPHWYNNRFGVDFLRDLGPKQHFSHCAKLVEQITVCRLKRPPSLSALPEIAEKVEEDLTNDA